MSPVFAVHQILTKRTNPEEGSKYQSPSPLDPTQSSEAHAFRGTKWQNVRRDEQKLYLTNAYRVLLTRARQGMVIFVPEGDNTDPTRPKEFYDGTYKFLQRCGLPTAAPRIISTAVNDGDNFHEIL